MDTHLKRSHVETCGWIAGTVERYHTWPTIRRQNIGEHTWNVLRLYIALYGPPPPHVTVFITFHDAGEVRTGDGPFSFKRDHPEVKRAFDAAEEKTVQKMAGGTGWSHGMLSTEQARQCKVCDLLEMLEFGIHELALGNGYGRTVINTVTDALDAVCTQRDHVLVQDYLSRTYARWENGEWT